MSEYRNVYVNYRGIDYRVVFHVGLSKVMCVARQAPVKHGRECFLKIGTRVKPIITLAREVLDSPLGSESP